MTTIDLRVTDPEVWGYICRLQHAEAIGRILQIRCGQCNAKLGCAANTAHGPGFASSWADWNFDLGEVHIDGERLRGREALRYVLDGADEVSGDWGKTRYGFFAALAIPTDLPQEYVPLLVRCTTHGDAVLNRDDVLGALRKGWRALSVAVTDESYVEVTPQQTDGLASESKSARLVHTIGAGQGMPVDEFRAWYAAQAGGRDLRDTPTD